jgi:hypothetical protein
MQITGLIDRSIQIERQNDSQVQLLLALNPTP